MATPPFIAGDWGTTHLRLFLCDGSLILERRSGRGVRELGRTHADEFDGLTADWAETHRVTQAILCGMVGSRSGWVEAPYVPCPLTLQDLHACLYRFKHREVEVSIVPGARTHPEDEVPDVMRGEETQIFGALSLRPALASGRHVLALPGTHTKWVEIDNGSIVRFRTALTGELFALLDKHSLLLASATTTEEIDEASFDAAMRMNYPNLLHALFQVRSRQLIAGQSRPQAKGWLSGLLIAADVDGGLAFAQSRAVTLIGEPSLTQRYARVLATRSVESTALDGSECAIAGLRALARSVDG